METRRQIRGHLRLRKLLDTGDPARVGVLIDKNPDVGSRISFKMRSEDPDVEAYLSYVSSMTFDQLPSEDRILALRIVKALGMFYLRQQDTHQVNREPRTAFYSISNNEFIPSPEVWYQQSGYDSIRQNYALLAKVRQRAGVLERFHRVELYRRSHAIRESPSYRFWLLLHLWEEAIVNGTEVILVDLDETPPQISEELTKADFHLISSPDGKGRLFQHTTEWQIFEEPHGGVLDPRKTDSFIAMVQDDSLLRTGHRITPDELRALCLLWSDMGLLKELETWEALRQQLDGRAALTRVLKDIRRDPTAALDVPKANLMGSPPKGKRPIGRTRIFLSYSRKDEPWMQRIRIHFKPLERDRRLEIWFDKNIQPGELWEQEIRAAIEVSGLAILIISADYLASEFITTTELPLLLKAHEERGLILLPFIVSASQFSNDARLSQFQSVNDPSRPLNGLTEAEQEKEIAYLVTSAASLLLNRRLLVPALGSQV